MWENMWRNQKSHTLWVNMETDEITWENNLEKYLTLSTKAEYQVLVLPCQFLSWQKCVHTFVKIPTKCFNSIIITVPNEKVLKCPPIRRLENGFDTVTQ